jgi:hypothetical protein
MFALAIATAQALGSFELVISNYWLGIFQHTHILG